MHFFSLWNSAFTQLSHEDLKNKRKIIKCLVCLSVFNNTMIDNIVLINLFSVHIEIHCLCVWMCNFLISNVTNYCISEYEFIYI